MVKGAVSWDFYPLIVFTKLTHLDSWLACCSIFKYGFNFAEIFDLKVQLFNSAVSLTSQCQNFSLQKKNILKLDFFSSSVWYYLSMCLHKISFNRIIPLEMTRGHDKSSKQLWLRIVIKKNSVVYHDTTESV